MCEKCIEIDGKIEHYQRLLSRITDERTVNEIKELLARMKARKARFIPSEKGNPLVLNKGGALAEASGCSAVRRCP
jgi:hypothetical protein